jgi:beta-lactamase regulating signal transducer with metallopeptidase domain
LTGSSAFRNGELCRSARGTYRTCALLLLKGTVVTVVHAMLSNAAIAALLALIALAVGYICRSPAVRHAVWVIVLLKLVTPPLFDIPLTVLPASWAEIPEQTAIAQVSQPSPAATYTSLAPGQATIPPIVWWKRHWLTATTEWAIAVWVVGAVGWFVWQGRRIARFRRRVVSAEAASPEVVEAARRIASALGITCSPEVKLATGIGSPMLWGWGRGVVVLFPRELLARLSPEARDTLLAHELAHYLRRDHWVRILEFFATGLYWWHPAVWLARRGIEIAEEECCDAWVVAGLEASPRRYAEALLATVDFEAELRRPCLPPGACAANRSARLLHRRLVGLIDAQPPRRRRRAALIRAVVVVALLTRPVLKAATPEPAEPLSASAPAISTAIPRLCPPAPPPQKTSTTTEPRAWATAAAPTGGLTVFARDHELVLRRPDGSSHVLGPGRPIALAFAPGAQQLATVGPRSLVRTWDDRGGLIASAQVAATGRALAYTPDGSQLLVLDAAGGITVLDPVTLARKANWSVEGTANSIACAPDNQTVAVSFGSWLDESGWVECWSITEKRKIASYQSSAPVGASRFTPDGGKLIIGGWNGVVAWRTLPSGELIAERQLPKDVVANTAFCPDAGTLPLEPPPEIAPPPTPIPLGLVDLTPKTSQFP